MQAAIGRDGDPVTITIAPELVRRLAEAIGDDNAALHRALRREDPAFALPHYVMLQAMGMMRQLALPDAPAHGLMAAESWQILKPIHLGDRITIRPRIAEVQERMGGRVGQSLFVSHEWRCANAADEEVMRLSRTVSMFPGQHQG